MSPRMLFLILLLIGALLIFLGKKADDKMKAVLIIIGILIALPGAFGVVTSFL